MQAERGGDRRHPQRAGEGAMHLRPPRPLRGAVLGVALCARAGLPPHTARCARTRAFGVLHCSFNPKSWHGREGVASGKRKSLTFCVRLLCLGVCGQKQVRRAFPQVKYCSAVGVFVRLHLSTAVSSVCCALFRWHMSVLTPSSDAVIIQCNQR